MLLFFLLLLLSSCSFVAHLSACLCLSVSLYFPTMNIRECMKAWWSCNAGKAIRSRTQRPYLRVNQVKQNKKVTFSCSVSAYLLQGFYFGSLWAQVAQGFIFIQHILWGFHITYFPLALEPLDIFFHLIFFTLSYGWAYSIVNTSFQICKPCHKFH